MRTPVSREFRIVATRSADLFGHKAYLLASRQGEQWEVTRGDHNADQWITGMDVSIAAEINDGITTMDWDGDEAKQLPRLSRRETEEIFEDS